MNVHFTIIVLNIFIPISKIPEFFIKMLAVIDYKKITIYSNVYLYCNKLFYLFFVPSALSLNFFSS